LDKFKNLDRNHLDIFITETFSQREESCYRVMGFVLILRSSCRVWSGEGIWYEFSGPELYSAFACKSRCSLNRPAVNACPSLGGISPWALEEYTLSARQIFTGFDKPLTAITLCRKS
jgi:hypothetical protein